MKRILMVCDGKQLPQGAFPLLKMLQQSEPVTVRALFFTRVDYDKLIAVGYSPSIEPYMQVEKEERLEVQQGREKFIQLCESHHIPFEVQDEGREWDRAVLARESRFADLMLISAQSFAINMGEEQPNPFTMEALRSAECPAILIPESFTGFKKIVVAYDGGKECMYALRQFCYLFPQFTEFPTEIIYVKNEKDEHVPEIELLKRYSRMKFSSSNIEKLHFDPSKYFAEWLREQEDIFLISGSFGRSGFSNAIRSSFVTDVIHEHVAPVFVAHSN